MVEVAIPASEDFLRVVESTLNLALQVDDDALAYMVTNIPIYTQREPTRSQKYKARSKNSTLLGLWAQSWPNRERSRHGLVFLFEDGIKKAAGTKGVSVADQTMETLLHEFGHALQRNHVLDVLERQHKVAAFAQQGGERG